jgi:hypothetical protein
VSDDRGPYSRLYHRFRDEFPAIYANDAAFAAWGRLLMDADASWPTRPALPRSIKSSALSVLVDAGLVTVSGDRYTVRGLDAERSRRRAAATKGGKARAEQLLSERSSDSSPNAEPRREETRREENEKRALDGGDPADRLYLRLGTYPSQKLLSWLDDLSIEAGGDAALAHLIDTTPHDGRDPKAYLEHLRDLIRSGNRSSGKAETEAEAERARIHRDEANERHLASLRSQPDAPSEAFSALVPRPGTPEATR